MNGAINQISYTLNCGTCWLNQNLLYMRSHSAQGTEIKQTSSKYIVENNSIVYEQYNRYGEVILRVPWSAHLINAEY
jgi:hypothetical protein